MTLSPFGLPAALQVVLAFSGRLRSARRALLAAYAACALLALSSLLAFGHDAAAGWVESAGWSLSFLALEALIAGGAVVVLLRHLRVAQPVAEQVRTRLVLAALLSGAMLGATELWDDLGWPPREAASEWYGWQTLSVDLSSLALIVLGAVAEDADETVLLGFAGYTFGAPVVHAVHRNDWWLPSLGMRVGSLALMGTGVFVALDECLSLGEEPTSSSCDERQVVGTVLFFTGLAGAVASIAVDAAKARSAPVTPETLTLGLWGDPFSGAAGVSVMMVR